LEINDGGIVKAPLDQVGCLAHWHLARRSSGPDFCGVTRLQTELATAGLNVHLAVDDAQNPDAVLAGLDVKLGAPDGRDCGLIAQLQLAPSVTVENVKKARQGIYGHTSFLLRHKEIGLGADLDRRAVGEPNRGAGIPAS